MFCDTQTDKRADEEIRKKRERNRFLAPTRNHWSLYCCMLHRHLINSGGGGGGSSSSSSSSSNNNNNKGKAIPLQAWTGPEGSRRLRLPDFMTIGT